MRIAMDFNDELLMSLLKGLNTTDNASPVVEEELLLASIDEELSHYLQVLLAEEKKIVPEPEPAPVIEDEALLGIIKDLLHQPSTPDAQTNQDMLLEQQAIALKNIEAHLEHLYSVVDTLRHEVVYKLPQEIEALKKEKHTPSITEEMPVSFKENVLPAPLPTLQLSKLYLPTEATVMYHYDFSKTILNVA